MAASPDVPHAQWTASTMDWNTLTFEAFDARGTTKRRKPGSNLCQVPGCNVDLSDAKPYFKRHCICSVHMKAPYVLMNGIKMRYCQQCGHFETLDVFVGPNRSCKMSLERRSAMAQHSKQKNGRSERARDQQFSKISASDDSSLDKGGGNGGKSSVWGSPTELKRSDIDKKGTTSGQARDVDMFADSTAATSQGPTFSVCHRNTALEAQLPAPVFSTAASSGAYFSAPGRLLPPAAPSLSSGATVALGALNLQQDSSGAASSGVGATGISADDQRLVMQLTHRSSALSQGQSSNLEQSHPTQLFTDRAGGTSRDGFGGGNSGLVGASSMGSTGVGAAFSNGAGSQRTAPVPTQVANGPSWKPGAVETGGGGGAYMQAAAVNNFTASATRYPGLGGGSMASLAESLLWEDPRTPLYSTATAPALHSMAQSMAGIQDAGLEQQLQDILRSARMEGMGWFGDGGAGAGVSSAVSGTMARNGVPSGWNNGSGLGPAWKGGVDVGGYDAYGMNGNGSAGLGEALQFKNLGDRGAASLAVAEPYTDQYAGVTSSLLSATAAYPDNNGSSRPSSMAAPFQRNTGRPTTTSMGLPGCVVGAGHQLHSAGGASSTSSFQTCMAYLQQQQRGRGGVYGAGESAMVGRAQRTMFAYRSGEPDPLVRVALKLTSRSPDELDSVTLASLRKLLSVYDRLQSMQGYVRPGCTHLIIDAHRAVGFPCCGATLGSCSGVSLPGLVVDPTVSSAACNGPPPAALQHNVTGNCPSRSTICPEEQSLQELADSKVQQSSVLTLEVEAVLQQLASVCCEGRGFLGHQAMLQALMQIANSNHTSLAMQLENLILAVREDGSLGLSPRLEGLPTIVAASCVAVSADDIATEVTLYGAHLQEPGVTLWARMHGVCYQLQTRFDGDGGVAVRLPLLNACGLLQLEASREDPAFAALGPSYPLLVLPNAAAVAEVHLIAGAMGPASLRRFVADLGALLGTGALLSQPLNGVVPVRSAAASGPSPSQPGTWGSTESEIQAAGEGAANHIEQGPTCLLGGGPGGAPLVAEMMEQAQQRGVSSRNSSRSGSPANSDGSSDFRLMNGDPTEGMSNADDEQVVELLLNANAVESLLESALALLHVMVERSMPHCLTAVVASLAELHERFPNRVHCGMLSPHLNRSSPRPPLQLAAAVSTAGGIAAAKRPQGEAHDDTEGGDSVGNFGLMHVAARAGDIHALVTLGSLEGVLGEQCSLLLRGVAGVTPLHLLAMLPDAPQLLRSLRRLFPGIEQALTTARADDGLTPLLLYQLVHPSPSNNAEVRLQVIGGSNIAGVARTESWDASRAMVGVAAISAPGNMYTRSFSDLPCLIGDEERFTVAQNAVKDMLAVLPPRALTSHLLGGIAQPEVTEPLVALCLPHDSSAAATSHQHPRSHPTVIVDERIPTDMLLAAASSEVFSEDWKSVAGSEGSRGSSLCGDTQQGYQADFLATVESDSDAAAYLATTADSDVGGWGVCMTNPTSAAVPSCASVTSVAMMAVDAAVRSRSAGRPVTLQSWAGGWWQHQSALPPAAGHVNPVTLPPRPSVGQVDVVPGQAAHPDKHTHAASARGASHGVPSGRVVSAVLTAPGAPKPVSEVFTTNTQRGQGTGHVVAPITYCTAPADSNDGSTNGVRNVGDGSGTTCRLEPLSSPNDRLLETAAAAAEASETRGLVVQPAVAMGASRTARTGVGSTARAGTSAAALSADASSATAAKPVRPNSTDTFAAAAPTLPLPFVALLPKVPMPLAAAAALQSHMSLVLALVPAYGVAVARQNLSYLGGGASRYVRFVGIILLALTAVQLLAAFTAHALGLRHNATALTLLHWLAEAHHVGLILAIASVEGSSTTQAAGVSAHTGVIGSLWLLSSNVVFGPFCYVVAALWPQLGVMRWAWLATRVHIIASSCMPFGTSQREA